METSMTTKTATTLTVADIEAGYEHDGWLGFGYLGERFHGDVRPLVLDCGHVAQMNPTFAYKVGERHRCRDVNGRLRK
jgi:hypothetical protein